MDGADDGAAGADRPAEENQRETESENVGERHAEQGEGKRIGDRQPEALGRIEIGGDQPGQQPAELGPRIDGRDCDIRENEAEKCDEQEGRRCPGQWRLCGPHRHSGPVR